MDLVMLGTLLPLHPRLAVRQTYTVNALHPEAFGYGHVGNHSVVTLLDQPWEEHSIWPFLPSYVGTVLPSPQLPHMCAWSCGYCGTTPSSPIHTIISVIKHPLFTIFLMLSMDPDHRTVKFLGLVLRFIYRD